MKSPITIDFVNSIIIVNAAYAKKASNPFSEEYEQLQRVRADYPTYDLKLIRQKRLIYMKRFLYIVENKDFRSSRKRKDTL